MAANDQHLKHGKALCGKVFGRFVETFNALVDFMLGLRGDAEGKNGEGHITYDRKNNIIRCDGCGGKGGGSGSDVTAAKGSGLTVDDGEIDLSGRGKDDTFGIHTMTVKGAEDEEDKTAKFLGTDDIEIPAGGRGGVESVNKADGKVNVIGGKGIRVYTDGQTIKITADEEKQEEDPDPQAQEDDPCTHPGDGDNGGGIKPDDREPGGGGGGGGGGGVAPETGGTHPGNDNCNCD